jgi:hypothetical protein
MSRGKDGWSISSGVVAKVAKVPKTPKRKLVIINYTTVRHKAHQPPLHRHILTAPAYGNNIFCFNHRSSFVQREHFPKPTAPSEQTILLDVLSSPASTGVPPNVRRSPPICQLRPPLTETAA